MEGDEVLTPAEAGDVQAWMFEQGRLLLWTVYGPETKDYPGRYVARAGTPKHQMNAVLVAPTLEELREALPQGLTMLRRHPEDEQVIMEVWL